jgi:hypothetical protein
MENIQLRAPASGDEILLRVVVIDANVATAGDHWLENYKTTLELVDARYVANDERAFIGAQFVDARLATTNHGPWFTRNARKLYARIVDARNALARANDAPTNDDAPTSNDDAPTNDANVDDAPTIDDARERATSKPAKRVRAS